MSTYTPVDVAYDYAIGGLPFLSAAGHKLTAYTTATLTRQTAPYRKDQTDQSTEVGEQSLSFWWLRSQSSFHAGAGQRFLDGGDTDTFRKERFDQSRNVNVWTAGEVKLLPKMTGLAVTDAYQVLAASPSFVWFTGTHSGTFGLWLYDTLAGTYAQVTGHTGGLASQFTSDGVWLYYATSTGVWKHGLTSAAGAPTQVYATATLLNLAYVKERLIGYDHGTIYELDVTAAAAALPTALYTAPNPGLYFGGVADAPGGFYIGATLTDKSTLYFVGLTTIAGVPSLGAPTPVLELPAGELFWQTPFCLFSYLGKFLAVGTNLGVRIGKINTDSTIEMGGLTLNPTQENPTASQWLFGGFASSGDFLYCSAVGQSPAQMTGGLGETCAFRIDLGTEIADGLYAWAMDVCTADTGMEPTSCCIGPDGEFYIAGNSGAAGLYKSVYNNLATDAYLLTSRIRFSTGEDKIFERLQLSAEGAGGSLSAIAYLNGSTGTSPPSVTLTGNGVERAEARIPDAFTGKKTTHIQVKLTFTPADAYTTAHTMKLRGYVLRALPGQKRQRVEAIPLLCYDIERDQGGQQTGSLGSAFSRLKALEALEEAGAVVTLQRFGPTFSSADDALVVIDDLDFAQPAAPNKTNGWGGVVMLTVRTVS